MMELLFPCPRAKVVGFQPEHLGCTGQVIRTWSNVTEKKLSTEPKSGNVAGVIPLKARQENLKMSSVLLQERASENPSGQQ